MGLRFNFALVALLAMPIAGCGSTTAHTESGGGEWPGFDSTRMVGQAPASGEEDIPQIDLVGEVPRPVQPRPVQPPPVVVEPPEYLPPAVNDGDESGALSFYDALSAASRQRNRGPMFNPTTKEMSDAVEQWTRHYSRLIQKLNPGF